MITGVFLISIGLLTQCILTDGTSASTSETKACKSGWTELTVTNATYTEGSICVKVNSTAATYLDSVKACRANGGELATILSEEYQVAVHNLIKNGKHWIGLSDFTTESSFSWMSGYPSLPAVFWAANEPNDGKDHEDCVAIDPSKQANESWFDEHCTLKLPSICMSAKFKSAPSSVRLQTENGTCPDDFFRMGNRCLKIITNETVTFDQARRQCQNLAPKLNGDLASIYSAEEQNILTAMILKESTAVWIGLYLHPTTRTHLWVRGLHEVFFTNWKRLEPNGGLSQSNNAEQCVMMYKRASSPGEWNDKNCEAKLGYICGVDLKPGKNDQKDDNPLFTSEGKCKKGEIEFENHCYKNLNAEFSSYEAAENACQNFSKHGHLTTPHNAYEMAFMSAMMNRLKIKFTLLGYQIKESSNGFDVIAADNSSDAGIESLKDILYFDVKGDVTCIKSTGDPQHKVKLTNCTQKTPFKALCNYPLKSSHFHPDKRKFSCKKDWTAITAERCIKFFHDKKNMSDAQKVCEHNKGSLISILNVHDQQTAAKLAKKAEDGVWIGLEVSFIADKGVRMQWIDKQPVTYINWRAMEPSRASKFGKPEQCVVLRQRSTDWNNVACQKKQQFICSIPGTHPTVAPPTVSPTSSSTTTPKSPATTTAKPTPKPATTPSSPKPKSTPKPVPTPRCPHGFVGLSSSKNCYQIFMKKKTWYNAENHCKTFRNGHLVSIHSETEQSYVNQLIKQRKITSSLWIGLNDFVGHLENQFSSWSDGTAMTVMFMAKNQISYFGNQDCVVYKPSKSTFGVWKKKHCTTKAEGYICMLSSNRKPMPTTQPDPAGSGGYCEKGFVKFNKTCYFLGKKPENFTEAEKRCKKLFSANDRRVHLARINNVETNDFLLSLLSPIKNGNAWIGMHYENKEFHWSDNKPVHFTRWPVNMTGNDKNSTCVTLGASTVTILSGFWYARNCGDAAPYLCQAPLSSTSTPAGPKCKEPYALYPDGKTCYRLLDKPTTFDEGMKKCEADQKTFDLKTAPALLSIDSVFEMSFIRAWMMESGAPLDRSVWLGLKLEKDKPVWKWTTGAPVNFIYTSGFPDDISGCYYMYIHRKISKDHTNIYGMHPDRKCDNGVGGKRTAVCKYSLESRSVVPKPKECLATKDGIGYKGHQAVTKSGKACVRWDTLNDINVLVQLNQKIGGSDCNFCRNPKGKPHQKDRPYCYTTRGNSSEAAKWEYCDIPLCSTAYAGHVGSHSYVVAVAILVIVLLVTISFFVGVMLWRRTNTARGFIPYLRQHDPEGGTSFHNPIYTPAANC